MINKIKLQNWKSHSETDLEFKKGINVLVGPMGAGKSSVLQAICFALFGSVPEIKRRELKTTELIKRNSGDSTEIKLRLSSEDKEFEVHRLINTKGSEATVRDCDGILLAGTNPTQANAFLKNILKLDEDTFLRTVYAKQNEIDMFLQLNPQERKTRLDELMGLHKFEAARKNCVKLANQIQARKNEKENLLKDLELENTILQIADLQNELLKLSEEKLQIASSLAFAQKEKISAEADLKEMKSKFEAFARLEERQKILIAQINEIRLRLKGPIQSQAELKVQLESLQNRTSALENNKFELSRKADSLNKELLAYEKEASVTESRLADTKVQLEKISALKLELAQLAKQTGIENPKEEFERLDSAIKELDKDVLATESELRLLKKHIAELMSAEGFCPTCARALELQTKDLILKEREASSLKLLNKVESQRDRKLDLELQRKRAKEILEQCEDFLQDINKEAELLRQQESLQNLLNAAENKLGASKASLEKIKTELESAERELSELRKADLSLRELLHLAELKEQQQQLEMQLTDVQAKLATQPDSTALETAEANFRRTLQQYEELAARDRSLNFIIEEKSKRLADFTKKQKQAEQILLEVVGQQRKVEFLQQFKNALLIAQETLRKELITAVNETMSSLWGKLYPYEKWTAIQLEASESDYVLQLRAVEGNWVSVAGFASGGERMLAALALRLAFAKVLAPEFNILILDEPTHNLDDAAINVLMLALQEHLSGFLEQLFIVTHEEKLAEVGDNIVRL